MLGETAFSVQLGDVTISKTIYEPGMIMSAHVHELPYVSLVVEGRFTEHRRDAPRQLYRNMLVFHPAGEEHADCVHDVSMATVNIEYRSGRLPAEFVSAGGPGVEALTRALLSALAGPQSQMRHALSAIDAYLWRSAPRGNPPPKIALARDVLAADNRMLSVSAVARELGMHRAALARTFKRTYGESPRNGLTQRRLGKAALMLTTSVQPIIQIAAECGYYDQSHFCRQFKRATGMSPSRYRQAFAA